MRAIWEISREFTEIGEMLIFIFLFLNVNITKSRQNKVVVAICLITISLMRLLFCFEVDENGVFLYEILDFIIIWMLLDVHKGKKIVIYIFTYVFSGEINIIILWIISRFMNEKAENLIVNNKVRTIMYIIISICMIAIKLVIRYTKKGSRLEISSKSYLAVTILILPVSGYMGRFLYMDPIYLSNLEKSYIEIRMLLIAVILLTNTLGIFILAEGRKVDKEKINYQNELIELQKKYYNEIKEKQEEIKVIRHDINAHLLQISQLYHQGKVSEFEVYLKKLECHWDCNKYFVVDTGNYTADIIFNYYAGLAVNNNIDFHCVGRFLEGLNMDEYDLCSLLSNGVSNAYEASKKYEKQKCSINIMVKSFHNILFLTISNTCEKGIHKFSEKKPSKNDKDMHGYGLIIIQKIVDKYNGTVKYSINNGMLYMNIILPDIY